MPTIKAALDDFENPKVYAFGKRRRCCNISDKNSSQKYISAEKINKAEHFIK